MKIRVVWALCGLITLMCGTAWTADNTLTDSEKAEGWKLLFDGASLNGWHTTGSAVAWKIEDGAIAAIPRISDYLVTDESFGDFVISADFKEDTSTNSGIFVRRPTNATNGCRGIECQICYEKNGAKIDKHSCGAIYDAVAPYKDKCKGVGIWQNMTIDCRDNVIKVLLNGELATTMDLDQWTVAGRAPDGSPNKFDVAYKDMPRVGQLALQNHGKKVWFKNIKIKPLEKGGK